VELEELKEESDSGKLLAASPTPLEGRRRSLLWLGWFAVLLLPGAVVVWFIRSVTQAPGEELTAVPLTSYPGYEEHPSFSPDGNQVAFVWNGEKQDNFDIYVKLIGSGPPLRLTTHPSRDLSPAWSPDGRSICFLRFLSTGKYAVLSIPALGGPERKMADLVSGATRTPRVSWSPNGNFLAISDKVSTNEPASLFLLSTETDEKRRLTSPPENWLSDDDPAFSPDGHTLAFIRSGGYSSGELYLLALSDSFTPIGAPKRLIFENRAMYAPAWTPDGREIIFASGEEGNTLWRMAAFGSGKPQRLAGIGEAGSQPAISRQGHRLAYTRSLQDEDIWRVGVARSRSEDSQPTTFISSTRVDGTPQFSPDGKKIAFGSGRSSRSGYEIWVCNSDGSGAVQLTSLGAESATPRWSPDAERIAFDSNVDGQFEIYVINSNGGRPQRLTSNPATDAVPSWSRDGKWIYFNSNRDGDEQIWKMPSGGGEPTRLTRRGGETAFESADGKSVYYTMARFMGGLWRVAVDGGEETEVLESVVRRCFTVSDEGIYFISGPAGESDFLIQFFRFASGEIKPIAAIGKGRPFGFTTSPDGQWFLYSQMDLRGSDLILVENFR
jgi:Tol biopolymer transport system component